MLAEENDDLYKPYLLAGEDDEEQGDGEDDEEQGNGEDDEQQGEGHPFGQPNGGGDEQVSALNKTLGQIYCDMLDSYCDIYKTVTKKWKAELNLNGLPWKLVQAEVNDLERQKMALLATYKTSEKEAESLMNQILELSAQPLHHPPLLERHPAQFDSRKERTAEFKKQKEEKKIIRKGRREERMTEKEEKSDRERSSGKKKRGLGRGMLSEKKKSSESSKAEEHKGKGKVKEGRKSSEKSNAERKGKKENKSSDKSSAEGKGRTKDGRKKR